MIHVIQLIHCKAGSKTDVERPGSVKVYNTCMGGIDKAVMLLSVYGTKYRLGKWYHRVAFHLFSLKVCNSWIIYQKLDGDNKSFVDFLAEICILLMYEVSSTADSEYDVHPEVYHSMRSADIPREKRYGKFNHWLILIGTPNSQRYKYKHCNKKRNINA